MEKGKTWTPRNVETANLQPTLLRIYYGETFIERRWKSDRPSSYYQQHRYAHGEDIGEFAYKGFADVPAEVLTAAKTLADVTEVADGPETEANRKVFDALNSIANYPLSYKDFVVYQSGKEGRKQREQLAAQENARIAALLSL